MRKATKVERQLTRIFDIIIVILIVFIIYSKLNLLITFLLIIFYFPLMHSIFSSTIGDFILGLRLVDSRGNKLTPSLAIFRFFAIISNVIYALLYSSDNAPNTFRGINIDEIFKAPSSKSKGPIVINEYNYLDKLNLSYEKDSNTYLVKYRFLKKLDNSKN